MQNYIFEAINTVLYKCNMYFIYNPLCMLQYVPISIPTTLTQTRKNMEPFSKTYFDLQECNGFIFSLHQILRKVLFKAQTMNFSYQGQITPNQILVDIFH